MLSTSVTELSVRVRGQRCWLLCHKGSKGDEVLQRVWETEEAENMSSFLIVTKIWLDMIFF